MKKGIITITALTLLLTLCSNLFLTKEAKAEDKLATEICMTTTGEWALDVYEDGTEYIKNTETGQEIGQTWYYDEAGNRIKMDLSDYARELNDSIQLQTEVMNMEDVNIESVTTAPSDIYIYKQTYSEDGTGTVQGCPVKITADYVGPATVSYTETSSITENLQVGFNNFTKSVITKNLTFPWNKTVSTNKSAGATFNVPKGKTGYVIFTPKNNYTQGILQVKTYNEANHLLSKQDYNVFAQSPIKLKNGFAEGTYSLVYR